MWERLTDGAKMVYVPGGTFSMGSYVGRSNEQPIHDVTLDSFWIDKTEVTNGQYELCVADGMCEQPESYSGDFTGNQQPVVGVNWDDAEAYCTWVGSRLPTEAEWEYAARGAEGNTYPWGNSRPTCDLLNYHDGNNYCIKKTTAVASYSPEGDSWVGASDMAGNVWEWVNDWYDGDYYTNSTTNNPTGPQNGSSNTLRGGSWDLSAYYARSSDRNNWTPTLRGNRVGFRCASPGI